MILSQSSLHGVEIAACLWWTACHVRGTHKLFLCSYAVHHGDTRQALVAQRQPTASAARPSWRAGRDQGSQQKRICCQIFRRRLRRRGNRPRRTLTGPPLIKNTRPLQRGPPAVLSKQEVYLYTRTYIPPSPQTPPVHSRDRRKQAERRGRPAHPFVPRRTPRSPNAAFPLVRPACGSRPQPRGAVRDSSSRHPPVLSDAAVALGFLSGQAVCSCARVCLPWTNPRGWSRRINMQGRGTCLPDWALRWTAVALEETLGCYLLPTVEVLMLTAPRPRLRVPSVSRLSMARLVTALAR